MPRPRVILNVYGGAVQDVFASEDVEILLVDWDTEGREPSDPGMVEISQRGGRVRLAYVAELLVHALDELPGTDVERALAASGPARDSDGRGTDK